ncbi:N-formylglutamate amidohydrolase [Nitrosomonas sp.]|uniref:N-formylglutamate amidohydrolase n=1 Tax=Nitrosomonas sp. TaxID=42353 RepID=UPI0020819423|nr:N-formylglutamate amidohydrolase [Nitrosomonas sp.]GJL74392.1 MAG: N-formylglutamate amidohydrolase [Nitrosomonas sp.]
MARFPVLLSIPHGGDQMPPEVMAHAVISRRDMLADSDAFTREIYGIKEDAAFIVDASIARIYVDLNRASADLPPANPDGIIKSQSCHGVRIYRHDLWQNQSLVNTLLEKYYHPYHQKIQTILARHNNLELMLDCHSMEAVGPVIGPDQGVERPAICLGSRHGQSCSPSIVKQMANAMRRAFALKEDQLTIDKPFAGGYITRHYGNNPIPCLQIELNRGLYLEKGWLDDGQDARVTAQKIAELHQKFRYALELFFA